MLFYHRAEHRTNEVLQQYDPEYIEQYYRYKDADRRRFMSADLSGAGAGPARRFGDKGLIDPPAGRHWMFDQQGIDQCLRDNRIYWTRNGVPRLKKFLDESPGMPASDLWTDIQPIRSWHDQGTGYDTQKPESLLERVVTASSARGDLVADLFTGSGTTLVVAEKLGRRWIGCDLGRYAIHTTRKRLLGIENCKPFEILNLGKYERQYWQGVTFGHPDKSVTEQALYEYLAFVLKLYGAQPLTGLSHIHGRKGKALIHIGAVDAPVTIDEINAAVAECVQLKQPELHVLGWEWEMGLYDLMVDEAKKQGIKLLLLQIPREVMEQQAVDKGDITFFELAYLKVEITTPKKLTALVALKEFVIPNTELIPDEVRSKIKKWSDYIDYWAVDWDFRNDTFMQGWVTYRTRKDRTLALASDPHVYEKAEKYRVLVKVVDIFGNDTTQAFDVEVG
jgi:adenine-specific DNA-methyltransferase